MRHLVHSLETGENVCEMVACRFAGADGLLVLTDRRVLALRDDYSRYSMNAAALTDVTLIDYGPRVHDGFAVFTDAGRVAVRKMNREDADRLVRTLTQTLPAIPVVTSHPTAKAGKNARPATRMAVVRQPASPPVPDPAPAVSEPAAPAAVPGAPPAAVPAPVPAAIAAPSIPDPAQRAVPTDKEVLYGVLVDLHARGLLTAEELAVKVAAVAANP